MGPCVESLLFTPWVAILRRLIRFPNALPGCIAGTVFSDKLGRIVLLDRFHPDIIPEGTFLQFRIFDRPGIIGKVGTILGNHSINIAGFGVSRHVSGEEVATEITNLFQNKQFFVKIIACPGRNSSRKA